MATVDEAAKAAAEKAAADRAAAEAAEKNPPGRKGYEKIINVGHANVGGYDFDETGKISTDERFDCPPGGVIEVTEKRARMLLKDHTAGEFKPLAEGREILRKRKEKEDAEKAAAEKKRARAAAAD